MALRVLLADESSTIKKVIQLALQDFAVQVKTVNVGVDALEVAKTFKPDIILADVLLQKKSGYEVCAEIKKDSELHHIPVILMWSGFLELDQKLFDQCKADDKLEKPFNVDSLRNLVTKYVPRLSEQQLTKFITLPTSITQGKGEPERLSDQTTPPPQTQSGWNLESFSEIDKHMTDETFSPVRLEPLKKEDPSHDASSEAWVSQDLSQFRIQLNDKSQDTDESPIEFQEEKSQAGFDYSANIAQPQEDQKLSKIPQLTEAEIENILRNQSREIIEAVVWKVVPELAGQIIRQELDRLLREEP